jgi:hypothetical protein
MMIRLFQVPRFAALSAVFLPGLLCAEFSLLKLQPTRTSQLPDTPTVSWNLGPTGLRGWVVGADGDSGASREILVTAVEKGSPAVGKFEPFDIITGVGGKAFTADARRTFGEAIEPAESSNGALVVTRWRNGVSEEIQLQIGKLPAYSDGGKCEKSERVLARAADYVASNMPGEGFTGVFGSIDALFLMAAGNPSHETHVQTSARRIADQITTRKAQPQLPNWEWSFEGLFLAEYHLATKDRKVLPALQILVNHLEDGQAASGSWGHSPATKGQTKGYGEVNSVGLPCLMTLALARECGIKVTQENLDRARNFFRRYTGIGSIPYGDHAPWLQTHGSNGKNPAAAVALMLTGDKEASQFFTRMSMAASHECEMGHTGNFFSYLWGPAGVGLSGTGDLAEFLKPQRWYYDLARRWDGSFITQPWPHKAEGKNGMNSYVNRGPLACTPSIAMAYAVPLRKLRIFGRAEN